MLDKIQIYIAIIAALVVLIAGMIENLALHRLTVRLIWVIILFYFVGLVIKNYLKIKVFPAPVDLENTEETSETADEDQNQNNTEDDEE